MRFTDFFSVLAYAFLGTTHAQSIPASCPDVPAPLHEFQLAGGWSAVKVAGNLTQPRGIVTDTRGRLLIVENSRGISQHTPSADGCIQSTRMLISQTDLNHGIYLSPDGQTLYASSPTTVWSWPYDPVTGEVGTNRRTLVSGMIRSGHVTRTLIIPPHRPDLLVVSHGSNGNLDYPSLNPATGTAIVKVFNLTDVPCGGHNFVTGGSVAGYGLRNEVGLAFDPNNMLWGVENSSDNYARTVNGTTTDIHMDNPAEELNYLGDITVPKTNNWYGYPTCFTVWDPEAITDTALSTGDQMVLAPNATFNDATCAQRSVPARLGFPAHTAPLDSKFDAAGENLYVSLHGSWNRQPPQGYKLVAVPFAKGEDGGYAPVAGRDSRAGYEDVLYPADEGSCSASTCVRPVGLVFDARGRLYMTADASGEVFLLARG